MNCAEVGDLMVDYLYHDLAPAERAAVQEHLANCADCAGQLERMQATTGWLDRAQTPLPQPLSPAPLLVRQAGEFRRHARRWRRGAVAAAVLAATVLAAIASIDHMRWQDGVLTVRFGRSTPPPEQKLLAVEAPISERLRRAESSINVLNESISQLAREQRQFFAEVNRAMEGTTPFAAGTVPASEAWLAEVGLGPDDF